MIGLNSRCHQYGDENPLDLLAQGVPVVVWDENAVDLLALGGCVVVMTIIVVALHVKHCLSS